MNREYSDLIRTLIKKNLYRDIFFKMETNVQVKLFNQRTINQNLVQMKIENCKIKHQLLYFIINLGNINFTLVFTG